MKETLVYLPTTRLYMETIKYDLVQYNTHDCMYVLFLRCITFRETDVAKASDIIYEFLRPSLKRTLSIVPQVKWTFNGNPYMSITWIVALPKYALDSITGYRRSLLNEVWNDHFGGLPERSKPHCPAAPDRQSDRIPLRLPAPDRPGKPFHRG